MTSLRSTWSKRSTSIPEWAHWPLPAFAAWALAWAAFLGLARLDMPTWLPMLLPAAGTLLAAAKAGSRARSLVVAAGFPLSLLVSGAAPPPPGWVWLLPLGMLLLLYPRNAWRDAPLFPTPLHALDGLPGKARLAPGARVLDAGCGLGHGLRELRRAYPLAHIDGVEWSWPLAWASRLTCRFAKVKRADMWAHGWADYRLVYLFQRPESLARALTKAQAEMADGAWIASLEFEAAGWPPQALLQCPDGRTLWLYRLPLSAVPQRPGDPAPSSDAGPGR